MNVAFKPLNENRENLINCSVFDQVKMVWLLVLIQDCSFTLPQQTVVDISMSRKMFA